MKSCKCGQRLNTAYIYRKKKKGKWESIGHYCTRCGSFYGHKKVQLSESIKTRETVT